MQKYLFIIGFAAFTLQAYAQEVIKKNKDQASTTPARVIHKTWESKTASRNSTFERDSAFRFQKKNEYPIVSFAVNNLGEVFTLNQNNQLKKFNEKGDSVGIFNQVAKFGRLTFMDVQNPWKTLLFFENFSNVVFLDKYLNVVSRLNLRKVNIFGVRTVATSYDNMIWVYDEQENKLKKIDDEGNILLESTDLRQVLDSVPSPVQIIDKEGFVYMNDPKKGIYIFDYYGAFKNKLPLMDLHEMAVLKNMILSVSGQYLFIYDTTTQNLTKSLLPSSYSSFNIANNKIYFLKQAGSGSMIISLTLADVLNRL